MVAAAGAAALADCELPEEPAVIFCRRFTQTNADQKNLATNEREGTRIKVDSFNGSRIFALIRGQKFLVPVGPPLALVRLFQIFTRFIQGALRGIAGLYGLAILVHGSLALSGGIKDFSQHDVAPDLSPAGFGVTVEGFAKFVRGRLVVALQKEDVSNAVVGQRAVAIYRQRFVEFGKRLREIALRRQLLAAADGHAHAQIRRVLEHPVVRIEHQAARLAESLNGKGRIRAYHFNALHLSLAVGIDLQLQGHTEQVQVLRDFADHAESFFHAIDGVLHLEFRRSSAVNPLR